MERFGLKVQTNLLIENRNFLMKRSDMLRIIWEAINELEDADHILTKIEKAGMIPPPCPGIYDLVPTVTPTGNLDYGWKRDWEKEDEE